VTICYNIRVWGCIDVSPDNTNVSVLVERACSCANRATADDQDKGLLPLQQQATYHFARLFRRHRIWAGQKAAQRYSQSSAGIVSFNDRTAVISVRRAIKDAAFEVDQHRLSRRTRKADPGVGTRSAGTSDWGRTEIER
jgi:hypothetical protein